MLPLRGTGWRVHGTSLHIILQLPVNLSLFQNGCSYKNVQTHEWHTNKVDAVLVPKYQNLPIPGTLYLLFPLLTVHFSCHSFHGPLLFTFQISSERAFLSTLFKILLNTNNHINNFIAHYFFKMLIIIYMLFLQLFRFLCLTKLQAPWSKVLFIFGHFVSPEINTLKALIKYCWKREWINCTIPAWCWGCTKPNLLIYSSPLHRVSSQLSQEATIALVWG